MSMWRLVTCLYNAPRENGLKEVAFTMDFLILYWGLLVPKLPLDYKMLLTHRMVAMAAGGGQSVLFLTPP